MSVDHRHPDLLNLPRDSPAPRRSSPSVRAYHGAVNGLRRLARGPRIKGVPMGRGIVVSSVCALLVLQFQIPVSTQAGAGVVQVTPLGSHAGELCFADRAIVFEDPKGVRILYDPGRTVDESDPRLGTIDVVLLSHVHADHLGDVRPSGGGGTCAAPTFGAANANSNTASVAAAKRAAVFLPRESATFLGNRIRNISGAATPACLVERVRQRDHRARADDLHRGTEPGRRRPPRHPLRLRLVAHGGRARGSRQ